MPATPRGTVLTLGYEGKTLDQVIARLNEHEVERLADVRAIAESSVDGFSKDEIGPALTGAGIDYIHVGELGDYQPESYPTYMGTEDWQDGFATLTRFASEGRTCLLCQCADVASCHRRYLAQRLREGGFRVVHLTPAGPKEAVTFEGA